MTQPRVRSMKQCADRLVNSTEPSEKYANIIITPFIRTKDKQQIIMSSFHEQQHNSLAIKIFIQILLMSLSANGFECTFHSAAVRQSL